MVFKLLKIKCLYRVFRFKSVRETYVFSKLLSSFCPFEVVFEGGINPIKCYIFWRFFCP